MSERIRERTVRWHDPAAILETLLAVPIDELLDPEWLAALPRPIAELIGFDAVSLTDGVARIRLESGEHHCNVFGTVHGGVVATVLDSAMWLALQVSAPERTLVQTLDLTVNFLRPIPSALGELHAEGTVVRMGRTVGLAEGRLTRPAGKLYAHGVSKCLVSAIDAGTA